MGHETDGALRVRAIVPGDADEYRSILQRTSPQDRYCRFFHVVDHFDEEDTARYVAARTDTIALIAERNGRALGAAHAFFIDKQCAEIAMIVASDGRGQGIGRLLFERLVAALQQRNCTCIVAYSLAQNGPLSKLARSVGMRPGALDGGIVTWRLSLSGSAPARAAHDVQNDARIAERRRSTTTRRQAATMIAIALLAYRDLLMLVHFSFTTTFVVWRPAIIAAASSLDRTSDIYLH
jgi:GNAT superfamily N-acetyltransferase